MSSKHGDDAGDIAIANIKDTRMNGGCVDGEIDLGKPKIEREAADRDDDENRNKRKQLVTDNASVPRASKRQRCKAQAETENEEKEIEIVPSPSATTPQKAVSPPMVFPPASGPCTCAPDGELHSCRANSKALFKEGDVVIVQERFNKLFQLKLESGAHINTRYGRYHHDDLIDKSIPGIRWVARSHSTTGASSCAGFMHVLKMGPKCWGNSISHKTQIVHGHDASIIISRLNLHAGCNVLEAGVGSGALTAQLAWAVFPHGSIRSFDFHKDRAHVARNILKNNIEPQLPISVSVGDVVANGFPGVSDGSVDAIFLDLPMPEKVVAEAYRALVDGGRLCCFSPCMEQVERTRKAMRASRGWHTVETITAPIRQFDTKLKFHPDEDSAAVGAEAENHHLGRIVRPKRPIVSKPFREMKSHTSYLTFATRIPRASEKLRIEAENSASRRSASRRHVEMASRATNAPSDAVGSCVLF